MRPKEKYLEFRTFILQHCGEYFPSKVQSHEKVTVSFRILFFVYNIEYLCQFSTKCKNQTQLLNLLDA